MTLHPILALDQVIADYRNYLQSEFHAKDPALNAALAAELDRPLFLAQEPFFQAHRPFRAEKRWAELPLEPQLARALAARTDGAPAYLHQSAAVAELLSPTAQPVVVTTGTGSGKTEAFLVPVIQNAINDATRFKQSGVTAILVYPMNALANDQLLRIEQYLEASNFKDHVRVAKYDRGTGQAERADLRAHPPHILLTNYMMLEYLLVRPADRDGIFANHRCRFLVLDEVHTYRGALGTNIALLMRRLRAHLQAARQDWLTTVSPSETALRYPTLIPVGTSATIKTVNEAGISRTEALRQRDQAVQHFFGKLVGVDPATIRVFGEEVAALTTPPDAAYAPQPPTLPKVDPTDLENVRQTLCALAGLPVTTALAAAAQRCRLLWDLNRWLVRQPLSVSQLVEQVRQEVPSRATVPTATLQAEVEAALVAGAALPGDLPGALRLRAHRFIRGGWQFHRCLNPACGRLYPMGEERCTCGYPTAPLHLCRNCGADYLQFAGEPAIGPLHPFVKGVDEASQEYMLYLPAKFETLLVDEENEDDTLEGAEPPPRRARRDLPTQMKKRAVLSGSFDPRTLAFSTNPRDYPLEAILAPARNRCLCCGGTAGSRNVVSPLAIGTSAALKVMAEGLFTALDAAHRTPSGAADKERLLIFCDSRQDAAHQARFIIFASRYDRLRRTLVQLLTQHGPLTIQRAVELLGDQGVRAQDNRHAPADPNRRIPTDQLERIRAWEEAPLLDEIAITAGYRATLLNLGLVGVEYEGLANWVQQHGAATAQQLGIDLPTLAHLCRSLLDEFRVRGALSRPMLCYHPRHPACPQFVKAADWERSIPTPQGYPCDGQGRPELYLDQTTLPYGLRVHNAWRRPGVGGRPPRIAALLSNLLERAGRPKNSTTELDMRALLAFLEQGAYLQATPLYGYREQAQLLQLNAETILLKLLKEAERGRCNVCSAVYAGAPLGAPCPACHGKIVRWSDAEVAQHRSVQRIRAPHVVPLVAGEHTAQVPNAARVELEDNFKAPGDTAKLNLLACSPTLEMGIDVGGLDAVALRNVPPRPDNYAQRGGRAGRRSRVGLVLGYARNTPHDQYFYAKPAEMIAGEVPAPALTLGNRDVLLRHLNAIIFGAAQPGLASTMVTYVMPQGELNQAVIDELLTGLTQQFAYAQHLAQAAFGPELLAAADLTADVLQEHLATLPAKVQNVFAATARQVIELRRAMERWYTQLQDRQASLHAGEMVASLLGLRTANANGTGDNGDDRSAGYPLRRFAEFGLLPGYEFPTEPATLRLLGDANEDDPVSTARRAGLAQFQPEAPVYARAQRWKVIGLDTASPWNPQSDTPNWIYRTCKSCELRYAADEPRCPRCHAAEADQPHPAFAYGGFIARRDEAPVLDEEERIAMRNLVQTYPQWNGNIVNRWQIADWSLRLSQQEEVRWLNEGLPPTQRALDAGAVLSRQASGFLLCRACGALLQPPEAAQPTTRGRRAARAAEQTAAALGHYGQCPQAHALPQALALMTSGRTEVLRLLVPVPAAIEPKAATSWGLSLGYALHTGMCQHYMLDSAELDFVLEGPWPLGSVGQELKLVSLTFVDPSLGGTGYLRRIAEEFHRVAQRALEHLDHPNCETACYRCLKSYTNQRYHDLLQWPLAIPALDALAAQPPTAQPPEAGDINAPDQWLAAYAAGVGSPLELKFWQLFTQHGFQPEKQVSIILPGHQRPLTIADFAIPAQRLAIYIDGASVHVGANLRRDRYIRHRLCTLDPPWTVIELRASDLRDGGALIERLRNRQIDEAG